MRKGVLLFLLVWGLFSAWAWAGGNGFTQADRERLIRVEATLKVFMEQTNKRFEDMNKRFEDMNKRFEDMNRRFEELRADMNARFAQVDKRFEELYTFLWIITGVFTALVVAVIGFAYWDRRTILRRAREEAVEEIERVYGLSQLRNLIKVLRELAQKDQSLAEALRSFGLL